MSIAVWKPREVLIPQRPQDGLRQCVQMLKHGDHLNQAAPSLPPTLYTQMHEPPNR
jgi:hypothetical protein